MSKNLKCLLGILLVSFTMVGCSNQSSDKIDEYFDKKEEEDQAFLDEQAEQYIREEKDQKEEYESESALYEEAYFIDNGYYFHKNKNCKGLEGYSDSEINTIVFGDLFEYPELKACNWCAK